MTEVKVLQLGLTQGGTIRLEEIQLNGASWPTGDSEALIAPEGYELVIRIHNRCACVFRRSVT